MKSGKNTESFWSNSPSEAGVLSPTDWRWSLGGDLSLSNSNEKESLSAPSRFNSIKSLKPLATPSLRSTTPTMQFKQLAQPWTPLPYMKRGAKFLVDHSAAALFLDPGMRKTSITLSAISVLLKRKEAKKILIIAPLRPCYLVWPAEIKKWKDFSHLRCEILHGPKKDEALTRDADIYIMNPEGLDWLLGSEKRKDGRGKTQVSVDTRRFKSLGFDTLVLDELTKFKHPSSVRFKAIKHVLGTFDRRWGLTGSPVANGLLDLFGQCYVLDLGKALGQFVTHFRSQFFFPVDKEGWNWKIQKGADEQIYARIKNLAFRPHDAKIELPELIDVPIVVKLPPEARKAYDVLEDDYIAVFGEKTILAVNAAAASGKCRQIASGAIYLDKETGLLVRPSKGKKEWTEVHTEKLDALESLIDELQGQQLLVGYDFNHDLERILGRIGKTTPYIGAGVSMKRSQEIESGWNSGEIRTLLGHPQSMGHGLNFQASECTHTAWFSATWDYELYDQFIRRVRRSGNNAKRIFNHLIIAENTVDEDQFYALRYKEKGQSAMFSAMVELTKKRRSR